MTNKKEIVKRWRNDAVSFATERLKLELEPEQIEILQAVSKHDRVSSRSGHGIGKSFVLAIIGLWWLFTRPNSVTVCTAPTYRQLKDILWKEYTKILDISNLRPVVNSIQDRIGMLGYEKTWHILARSSREPENLAGFHAKHLLYLIDEASGLKSILDETIEGALTEPGNKLAMAGNPTKLSGIFYNSFHRDRGIYVNLHFNSEKSKRVSKKYCETIAAKYGKDSDIYRVRVQGDFPKGEPDVFIPLWLAEQSVILELPESTVESWEIGIDPARYGDDESVICLRHNNEILPFINNCDESSVSSLVFNGVNTNKLAAWCARLVRNIRSKYNFKEKMYIKVDDSGLGGGVTDNLQEVAEELNVIIVPAINNGVAEKEFEKECHDLGTQMWFEAKESLKIYKIPNDDDLIGQMTTRKYKPDSKGRIQLETKESMKKRGLKSPDRSDAYALCVTEYKQGGIIDDDFTTEVNYN